MAILQISKIQQRSGNLVDLPQLDDAEFGWATDAKRLFIGKTTPNENIEVLTSYSQINFSQINGTVGNLNISNITVADGQVLTYSGNTWVNRGGDAGGLITLGDASNVKITGGATGYVLETDGLGNLTWTPKSTIIAYIEDAVPTAVSRNQTFATNTTVTTNLIELNDTTGYNINNAVIFSGTTFGNVSANTIYYISNVDSPNSSIVISTSADGNSSNIVPLTTASGNMTVNIVGTVITTTQDNFFTQGAEITITDVPGMVELNGNVFYVDVLTSNTFALYNDSGLDNAVNSTEYGEFPYTTVSATSTLTDEITVADSSLFSINDPVVFAGDLGNSTIVVGQTYYIEDTPSATAITISETAGGNVFDPGTEASPTNARVYIPGGRIIGVVGSGASSLAAGGANTQIQYNDTNVLQGNADFTYNNSTKLLTLNGNANVGNLNSTGIATATRFISNVTTGTAPFVVTSTTQVANLNVATSGTAGTVTTAAQPNITSVGTLTSVAVTGNANVGNLNATTAVVASTITSNVATGTAPLTVTSTTRVANLSVSYANVSDFSVVTSQTTGTYYPVFVNGSSTANYALAANSGISANLANGAIISSTFVGNLTGNVTGNVSGNISGTIVAPGANTEVIFNDSGNVNATSGLTFNKSTNALSATGNISGGNLTTAGVVAATGNVSGGNLTTTGALSVTGNANVGNIGAAAGVFSANVTGANVTSSGYFYRSVATSQTAAGTVQGNAATFTTEIVEFSTVASGSGAVLPSAAAGLVITIVNTSANTLNVYPASGDSINSLGTNAAYTHVAGATLQYVALDSTRWYTVGATFA